MVWGLATRNVRGVGRGHAVVAASTATPSATVLAHAPSAVSLHVVGGNWIAGLAIESSFRSGIAMTAPPLAADGRFGKDSIHGGWLESR
jgi:hypothetical protein